jgi:sulfoxide reductase heme-binding subunit YedZ
VVFGASFAARRVIGYRAWRAMHWLSFPAWAMALAHGIGAGTDSASWGVQALYAVTAAVVVFMAIYRVLTLGARRTARSGPVATEPPYDRFAPAESRARTR